MLEPVKNLLDPHNASGLVVGPQHLDYLPKVLTRVIDVGISTQIFVAGLKSVVLSVQISGTYRWRKRLCEKRNLLSG
jgi:hypothetical protein